MKKLTITLLSIALIGCQGQAANGNPATHEAEEESTVQTLAESVEQQFPFPQIPATLRTPEARKDYLLRNYWTAFDFANRPLLDNRDVTEQGLVNFIALLADGQTDQPLADAALATLTERMMPHADGREVMGKLLKDYLYNPNSPMYNEPLYARYLHAVEVCGASPSAERQRARYLLRLIERNRPGEVATDFTYYNKEGKRMTLAQTAVKGDRLMLLFYDPECDECHALLERMKADTRLTEAVRMGKVTVLAVYTEGDDEVWRRALPDMPSTWLVGTDRGEVKERALYDLKAMPCLYLLDSQKHVILKDAEYEEVMK